MPFKFAIAWDCSISSLSGLLGGQQNASSLIPLREWVLASMERSFRFGPQFLQPVFSERN